MKIYFSDFSVYQNSFYMFYPKTKTKKLNGDHTMFLSFILQNTQKNNKKNNILKIQKISAYKSEIS